MLLSHMKNGLTSLFKEVRVFKEEGQKSEKKEKFCPKKPQARKTTSLRPL